MGDYRKQMNRWLESNRPFSATEIRAAGIPSQILVELRAKGIIERISRGVYLPVNARPTENLSLQSVALKVPDGVICLLSALRFHNFTTQLPHEVWLAIKPHHWIPRIDSPQLQVVTMSETPFSFGIEEHDIDGITVKVYSAAKTVADCFKFRNKVGLDVAMEALKEGYRAKLFTASELYQAEKACRVANIIRPYEEMILFE